MQKYLTHIHEIIMGLNISNILIQVQIAENFYEIEMVMSSNVN